LEDLSVNERVIQRWILNKYSKDKERICLILEKVHVKMNMNFWSP